MQVKKFFQSLNQGITFILGLVFIFGIGVMYAYVRPEDLLLNAIFFTIAGGWVIFTIKYIWDALEKKETPKLETTEYKEMEELIKNAEAKLQNKEPTKQ